MNFSSLPTEAKSILAMRWQDYAPFYADLESRTLDESTLDSWLDDWSALASCIDEQFTRLQVVTSQYTANEELQKEFDTFLDEVQPAARSADQKIKENMLASGLHPKGFEVALKMMQAEADIFCTENLPYMALVDAFQHWIYENPSASKTATKCEEKWGELWDRFMKGIDYSDFEEHKKLYWHRQGHIHTTPFYYLEYGLAQLGAVQVFGNARVDQKKAVANYRKALALGSTKPLPELFAAAGARFAFDADTLKGAVDLMEEVITEMVAKL